MPVSAWCGAGLPVPLASLLAIRLARGGFLGALAVLVLRLLLLTFAIAIAIAFTVFVLLAITRSVIFTSHGKSSY